jgi:hypothetical protein
MAADVDPQMLAEVAAVTGRLRAFQPYNIGFPGAVDFDYTPLAGMFTSHLLNNVGHPHLDGTAHNYSKEFERLVVDFVADLFRAPAEDRWGYVMSGGRPWSRPGRGCRRGACRGARAWAAGPAGRCDQRPAGSVDRQRGAGADAVGAAPDHPALRCRRHRDRPAVMPHCHRIIALSARRDGIWLCRNGLAKSGKQPCARCGASREPAARNEQGRPWCAYCLSSDPANQEACIQCGRTRVVAVRSADGPLASGASPEPCVSARSVAVGIMHDLQSHR